ncbi:MAG: RICIN domain-containing protein, partial [Ruminococcus sp.]|nr:RICIN domain-containing protein [Ruminococcus sp.]
GINDTNYSNATEYYNTVTDMVKRAKAKGIEVILVKQQGRKGDYTKNPLLTSRWFASELDKIGTEQNVKVVDLFNLFQNYCVSIGADASDALYYDNIHPNRKGALKLAELFAKQIDWNSISGSAPENPVTPPEQNPSELEDGAVYMLKNANSGMYMEVAEENASNSANVQQWTSDSAQKHNTWKAVSAGNGYYYLYTQLGDGNTFVLDVSGKKTEDGTNVEIYTYKGGDNQQFRFAKNNDGSYTILTKITGDASCVEVTGKSTETGGNIQQWTANGGNNQKWILEKVSETAQPEEKPSAGDVNLDGDVNIADAVKLQRYLLGAEKLTADYAKTADVNSDGYVDVFDMVALRKILVG